MRGAGFRQVLIHENEAGGLDRLEKSDRVTASMSATPREFVIWGV